MTSDHEFFLASPISNLSYRVYACAGMSSATTSAKLRKPANPTLEPPLGRRLAGFTPITDVKTNALLGVRATFQASAGQWSMWVARPYPVIICAGRKPQPLEPEVFQRFVGGGGEAPAVRVWLHGFGDALSGGRWYGEDLVGAVKCCDVLTLCNSKGERLRIGRPVM